MVNINSQFESDIQSNLPSSEFVGSNPTLTTTINEPKVSVKKITDINNVKNKSL